MILIAHKRFQKITEGTLPQSFQEASIMLIPNPDKDITRQVQINISHEYKQKCEIFGIVVVLVLDNFSKR